MLYVLQTIWIYFNVLHIPKRNGAKFKRVKLRKWFKSCMEIHTSGHCNLSSIKFRFQFRFLSMRRVIQAFDHVIDTKAREVGQISVANNEKENRRQCFDSKEDYL